MAGKIFYANCFVDLVVIIFDCFQMIRSYVKSYLAQRKSHWVVEKKTKIKEDLTKMLYNRVPIYHSHYLELDSTDYEITTRL